MAAIDKLLQKNQGYATYSQIKAAGTSDSVIRKMLDAGEIEKEKPGIYKLPEIYIDELYILQHRYPKGIYSLEMALWLLGLSLTVPFEPIMSFPYGTNTRLMKRAGVKPVVLRSNYEMGVVKVNIPSGQQVRAYEMERTLAECLRPVYKTDIQIIAPAFKAYMQRREMDFSKIFQYAKLFKVESKVQSYLEVLQ